MTNGHFTPVDTRPTRSAPKGWRWTLLNDVARLESGHTPSRRVAEYWEGGTVPWLSLRDISRLVGRYVDDTENHPTLAGIENSSARLLPAGTVAFCRTASVGRTAILGREMATSQDFVNWICGPALDPEYLYVALMASGPFFEREKQGSTHKTIYFPTVNQFQLLLPPLPEQKRIAAILDKADAIRRKRQQSIRLTEELLRSAFLDMFGDFMLASRSSPLESLVEQFIDYRGKTPKKSPTGVPLVTAKVIKGGHIRIPQEFIPESSYSDWMRRGLPQRDDLLFTTEAPLGEMALVEDERIALAQRVLLIRPNRAKLNSTYLMWALRSPGVWHEILQRASGSTVQGIRQKELRLVSIPLPPLDLQAQFELLAQRIACRREANAAAAAAADELVVSLTHSAFSGRL